jgi:hypothetical protein
MGQEKLLIENMRAGGKILVFDLQNCIRGNRIGIALNPFLRSIQIRTA